MKKLLLSIFALFACALLSAQVGIGTTTPSNASNLEVSASDDGVAPYKGFMPPRVRNITQRDLINATPFDYGLLVFVADTGGGVGCLQIWDGDSWEDVYCSSGPITVPPNTTPWVNEIHYEDVGAPDTGEGVEIAGMAGTDLTGYVIYRFNGASGATYGGPPIALSGVIGNEGAGYGALWFSFNLQNGNAPGTIPDGIVLYDTTSNTVVKFLSYEGSFVGNEFPVLGMTSTDIGVEESPSTPVGESLQLTGSGNAYNNFTWQAPATSSPGALNSGQVVF